MSDSTATSPITLKRQLFKQKQQRHAEGPASNANTEQELCTCLTKHKQNSPTSIEASNDKDTPSTSQTEALGSVHVQTNKDGRKKPSVAPLKFKRGSTSDDSNWYCSPVRMLSHPHRDSNYNRVDVEGEEGDGLVTGRGSVVRTLPISPTAFVFTSIPSPTLPSPVTSPGGQSSIELGENNMCRICHDGDQKEALVSPCHCAGTMGMLHMTCLEKWLGSSKTTKCEICQYQFEIVKKPRPLRWYLSHPNLQQDRHQIMKNIVLSLVFAIFATFVCGVCILFAEHFATVYDDIECAVLILISCIVIILFVAWVMVVVRRSVHTCRNWRKYHHTIQIHHKTEHTGQHFFHRFRNRSSRGHQSQAKLFDGRVGTVEQIDILQQEEGDANDSYKAAMSDPVLPQLLDQNNNDPGVASLEDDVEEEFSTLYYQPSGAFSRSLQELSVTGHLNETGV